MAGPLLSTVADELDEFSACSRENVVIKCKQVDIVCRELVNFLHVCVCSVNYFKHVSLIWLLGYCLL